MHTRVDFKIGYVLVDPKTEIGILICVLNDLLKLTEIFAVLSEFKFSILL